MTKGLELDRARLVPLILERIENGTETITAICNSYGMARCTLNSWRAADADLDASVRNAKRLGCHAIADECLAISDTPLLGEECEYDDKGNLVKRKVCDMLGHRKFMVETRLNLIKKWMPDVYGDKHAIDHSSTDGTMSPKPVMSKEELRDAVKDVVGKF
jgi:hypothetical protein